MRDMHSLLREIKGEAAESRTIAIVSGKGGVGKTATAANLALALKDHGEKVVAIDCDQAAANLSLHLGMKTRSDRTLQHALENDDRVLDAINLHHTGLMVIPSSHATEERSMDKEKLQNIINRIDGTVLIDAPPGLTDTVHTVLEMADEVIIVTNPEIPAVSDAVKVAQALKEKQGSLDNCWTVITKANETEREVMETEIEMALETPIVSVVPYDPLVKESINEQVPVVMHAPHSHAANEYHHLAAWLVGEEHNPHPLQKLKRFFHKLRRKIAS